MFSHRCQSHWPTKGLSHCPIIWILPVWHSKPRSNKKAQKTHTKPSPFPNACSYQIGKSEKQLPILMIPVSSRFGMQYRKIKLYPSEPFPADKANFPSADYASNKLITLPVCTLSRPRSFPPHCARFVGVAFCFVFLVGKLLYPPRA